MSYENGRAGRAGPRAEFLGDRGTSQVVAYGPQQVGLPERRPVRVAEEVVGVAALPEQKIRRSLLTAGADDDVGNRQVGLVQMTIDVVGLEIAGKIIQLGTPQRLLPQIWETVKAPVSLLAGTRSIRALPKTLTARTW